MNGLIVTGSWGAECHPNCTTYMLTLTYFTQISVLLVKRGIDRRSNVYFGTFETKLQLYVNLCTNI